MDKLTFCIIVLVHATFAVAASAVPFYHEPSYIVLEPKVNLTDTLDFGFAMGYQEAEQRLVVGAPHADQVGRVYGCHLEREPKKTVCEQLDIDVKKLASDYDKNNTEQMFYLGASIAATSKAFFTCAPLWTTGPKRYNETFFGTYGTCFAYYNKDNVQRIRGLVEQQKNSNQNNMVEYNVMYGGVGWSSLADEKNKVLLMGKLFDIGDIQYITHLELNEGRSYNTNSLTFRDEQIPKLNIRQLGYALAAGKFFDDRTLYACSVQFDDKFQKGIMFLENENTRVVLLSRPGKRKRQRISISFRSEEVGDFFGASLLSADMSADNFTDLLVGAPAHSILGVCETGALYIYLNTGGEKRNNMTILFYNMENNRLRIESDKPRSRFGTAIASTDLDGDMKPEIIVSAPYEDFGAGAVYILSGNEVLQRMTLPHSLSMRLKDLRGTQRIQKTDFRSFGFSLQVVPNINNNGCDGLAVGSPQIGSVALFQCVPTIDAFLSIEGALDEVVKSTDTNFTVKVCITVVYHTKSEVISTKFKVITEVHGEGPRLASYKLIVDISDKKKMLCENVIIPLRHNDDIYVLKSELGYLNEELFNQTDFDPSWVRLSDHSQLQSSKTMKRTCKGTDCVPELDMRLLWGGSNTVKEFYVEERTKETVTLLIENIGANANSSACVSIRVTGAEEHIQCDAIKDKEDNVITCGLPSLVARNTNHNLSFVLDINKVTNVNDTVHIKAELFADCEARRSKAISRELDVKLIFVMKKVYIADGSHNVTVTEKQRVKEMNSTFVDKHEYKIVNNGSLLWENVAAVIHVPKKTFVQNYSILLNQEDSKCVETDTTEFIEFLCTGIELSNKPILIYLRTTIPYINITENLKIDSSIELRIASSNNTINLLKKSQTTTINYVKDEAVIGNNKTAILIIVLVTSIVILLVVAAILYKVGFFKRKELSRLDSFKASVKSKKSQGEGDMPSTSAVGDLNTDSKEDSMEDFDIEVVDDSPFEAVPLTVDDEASLIVEDKPPPKSRTRSTSSQLDKRENKRKASSASHTSAADKESTVL